VDEVVGRDREATFTSFGVKSVACGGEGGWVSGALKEDWR